MIVINGVFIYIIILNKTGYLAFFSVVLFFNGGLLDQIKAAPIYKKRAHVINLLTFFFLLNMREDNKT